MDLQQQMDVLMAKREATAKEKAALGQKKPVGANVAEIGTVAAAVAEKTAGGQLQAQRWQPAPAELTKADKEAIRRRLGLVKLEDLKTDHMTAEERALFLTAVEGVRAFVSGVKEGRGSFFVMVASQVYRKSVDDYGEEALIPDMDRTGYGVGKTTMAKAVADSLAKVTMEPGDWDTLAVQPGAKFLTGGQLMALFDDDDFKLGRVVNRKTRLLVIDDVGREPPLRYVRSEDQETAKQARYFEVINACYDWGVPLFITSNLRAPQLAQFLGGACWSRIQERAPKGCRFDLTGVPDYRPILGGHKNV